MSKPELPLQVIESRNSLMALIDELANEISGNPERWQQVLDRAHSAILQAVSKALIATLIAKEGSK